MELYTVVLILLTSLSVLFLVCLLSFVCLYSFLIGTEENRQRDRDRCSPKIYIIRQARPQPPPDTESVAPDREQFRRRVSGNLSDSS